LALDAPELLLAERAHADVGIVLEVMRRGQIALEVAVAVEALGERLQPRVLYRQLPELRRPARHLVGGQEPSDLLEALGELLQALADGVLHGGFGRGILRDVCSL